MTHPLLRKVDAVTFQGAGSGRGACLLRQRFRTQLAKRRDRTAGLSLPDSDTEIVLTTEHGYEPNWLVESADDAVRAVEEPGGSVLAAPFDIPVGRVAVVADPFGNVLVLSTCPRAATRPTTKATSPGSSPARSRR